MQRCGGSPREISPSPRSGRENTAHEGERGEGGTGDWGNADWMGRNRIYEEARKQSGVDRGWGERERETEISTPGLLLHVRVEIRVGLIRIGRWSRMEERVWGIFLIGWNSDSFQLRRKKKTWNYYGFSSEFELIWINLCKWFESDIEEYCLLLLYWEGLQSVVKFNS